ncbi:ArsR/SmtB family transcription factor [Sphingomonas sp. S2-65]|uniref:ArsR/SmtB family transcription factor n=1 Tax=Sphingomonas sp. S2-65 TaxID=2903960 RepID=UPI001F459E99|nr:metalloregulator ArsR/SmtB family transcription factor [Sphingomonas sp. S2-65]UYY58011.1 metalloregulator ArsR/SmtB family transcription factor [Sphingomonas sp. S2-65]
MDAEEATTMLSALAQSTRLNVFRVLQDQGAEGLAAGLLAQKLGVPHNTMSTHLKVLEQAGLVSSRRISRSVIYRADDRAFGQLVDFLGRRIAPEAEPQPAAAEARRKA